MRGHEERSSCDSQRGPGGGHRGLRAVAGWYALDSHHQKEAFAGLSQAFVLEKQETGEQPSGTAPTEETSTVTLAVSDPNTPPRHDLAALQGENSDCVGWLTIPETTVDYPVMFTPSEPEHYLRRD